MRLSVWGVAAMGLFISLGCKPPPKDVTEARFKSEVRRYFSNLNSDNERRRESLRDDIAKHDANPTHLPPSGLMFNTYVFDPEAFVVTNYKCRACGVKLMVLNPGLEYLCPACHHSPYLEHPKGTDLMKSPCTLCVGPEHKPKAPDEAVIQRQKFEGLKEEGAAVKPLFEVTQEDTSKPMEAIVRYVRRSWAYDRRGAVSVPQKAIDKAASNAAYLPQIDGSEGANKPGFHRLDASFLGEIKFKLKGDALVKLEGPKEEPLRLWKDLSTIK
jgi:hypothetical protein